MSESPPLTRISPVRKLIDDAMRMLRQTQSGMNLQRQPVASSSRDEEYEKSQMRALQELGYTMVNRARTRLDEAERRLGHTDPDTAAAQRERYLARRSEIDDLEYAISELDEEPRSATYRAQSMETSYENTPKRSKIPVRSKLQSQPQEEPYYEYIPRVGRPPRGAAASSPPTLRRTINAHAGYMDAIDRDPEAVRYSGPRDDIIAGMLAGTRGTPARGGTPARSPAEINKSFSPARDRNLYQTNWDAAEEAESDVEEERLDDRLRRGSPPHPQMSPHTYETHRNQYGGRVHAYVDAGLDESDIMEEPDQQPSQRPLNINKRRERISYVERSFEECDDRATYTGVPTLEPAAWTPYEESPDCSAEQAVDMEDPEVIEQELLDESRAVELVAELGVPSLSRPAHDPVDDAPNVLTETERVDMTPTELSVFMHLQQHGLPTDSSPQRVVEYLFPGKAEPLFNVATLADHQNVVVPLEGTYRTPLGEEVIKEGTHISETLGAMVTSDMATTFRSTAQERDTEANLADVTGWTVDPPSLLELASTPHEFRVKTLGPAHHTLLQLRGSMTPSWFPGYFAATSCPDEGAIVLARSPSAVLATAYLEAHPDRYAAQEIIIVGEN